jgi:hypothetical protein
VIKKYSEFARESRSLKTTKTPRLKISKLGVVSRDYSVKYPNGYRDFSYGMTNVLKMLDQKKCDAVLFSLYGIDARRSYSPLSSLKKINNIKAVFLEKFKDGKDRDIENYVVYHRKSKRWDKYELEQLFGSLTEISAKKLVEFVQNEMPKRNLGNCCVLLCGETNGVKYSKNEKRVKDSFGLRAAISNEAKIVLNPIHDRMTRPEMPLKRRFLSANDRWVVSVWNKGRKDKSGKVKDGKGPAWMIFHNGKKIEINRIANEYGWDIGILDIDKS